MKRSNRNLLEGNLFSSIILYTIPIILTSVLQLTFNAADLMIVGQFCGSISVAAVGATSSLTNLMVNFFIGLSVGTGVTVAHGIGSRDDEEVQRAIHTALPTALISGGILTVLGISLSETFLTFMGTPDTVLPLSAVYMKIYFSGVIFTLIYNFCAAILRAAGDTKSPLIYLTLSGIINVALNVVFVTMFHMNVAGVALATILSQGVAAILVVIALMRRTDACKFRFRKMKFHKRQFRKILRIGLPAGIQSSLFSISNVLIQSSVNTFGDVFMSGNAAASNLEGFVYVALNAFQQTSVNFVGQNAGARQWKRVYKTVWLCLGCVTAVGLVMGFLVYSLGPVLLRIYITDSLEAIGFGMIRLTYICLPYFLCGLMEITTGALRGLGASLQPMIITVMGVCGLRIMWIYTIFQIPQFHTPHSLYISYPISWAVTFLVQLLVLMKVCKRFTQED